VLRWPLFLFALWLAKHGWEPGEFNKQACRMLGLDAAGNDIKLQVSGVGWSLHEQAA
jgi:hypothetical protein